MKNHILYLLSFSFVVFSLSGCKEESTCGGEMKMIGDQYLDEEESGSIAHFDYPDEIKFIDTERNEFAFVKVKNDQGFEKKVASYNGTCDDGVPFSPYYNREFFTLSYAAVNSNDTISITVRTFTSLAVTSSDNLSPTNDTQIGRARFIVRLSFEGCEVVETAQLLSDSSGDSYISTAPFPESKFNQTYDDLYNVRRTWSNSVWFSFSRGIVAFDFCGRDYAQVVDD